MFLRWGALGIEDMIYFWARGEGGGKLGRVGEMKVGLGCRAGGGDWWREIWRFDLDNLDAVGVANDGLDC